MFFIKTQQWMIAKGAAIASSFVLLSPLALANTPCLEDRAVAQPEITEQLDSFERTAASTRSDLDHYASAARHGNLNRQSHVTNLEKARENVNLLGKQMSELETLNSEATPLQQAAIREARPHLEQLADHVQAAILMLNEGARGYRSHDFGKAVNGMYKQSDRLYTKVDALTDFERACQRAVDATTNNSEI
jgi:DNA repair ATPase RecN